MLVKNIHLKYGFFGILASVFLLWTINLSSKIHHHIWIEFDSPRLNSLLFAAFFVAIMSVLIYLRRAAVAGVILTAISVVVLSEPDAPSKFCQQIITDTNCFSTLVRTDRTSEKDILKTYTFKKKDGSDQTFTLHETTLLPHVLLQSEAAQ